MANTATSNLLYGLSIAAAAQADANSASVQANLAENRARSAELALAGVTTNRDLERRLETARDNEAIANAYANNLKEEIKKKDEMILDWMLGNEAFKRLAKQYGNQLGISVKDMQDAVDHHTVDIAEENPEYKDSASLKNSNKRLENKIK